MGMQSQILTHQGTSTYLVQGGSMDSESHALQHAARASPQTVSMQQVSDVRVLLCYCNLICDKLTVSFRA